jgi:hypothetical protein
MRPATEAGLRLLAGAEKAYVRPVLDRSRKSIYETASPFTRPKASLSASDRLQMGFSALDEIRREVRSGYRARSAAAGGFSASIQSCRITLSSDL